MKFDITMTTQEAVREMGSRLAGLRLARNITQAELSARSGVPQRTLARLEKGEKGVHLASFVAVCSALALTPHFEVAFPSVEQSPEAAFLGVRPRERARKTTNCRKAWGDET